VPPTEAKSAHSLGCGGGGTPPKGLWPPAEPPTPCVPGVYDCALFFSALHLASEAWRWRSVRAYSVLGSTWGGGLSPKRLCIYPLLSMCGCCPHREQSAHGGGGAALAGAAFEYTHALILRCPRRYVQEIG
jgi:hypothetical protein